MMMMVMIMIMAVTMMTGPILDSDKKNTSAGCKSRSSFVGTASPLESAACALIIWWTMIIIIMIGMMVQETNYDDNYQEGDTDKVGKGSPTKMRLAIMVIAHNNRYRLGLG